MQIKTWGGEKLHNSIPNLYYRLAFENNLLAQFITQPSGSIICANISACQMLGWTEAELCQMNRDEIVDLDDNSYHDALKTRSDQGEVCTEIFFIRKNGSKFPARVYSKIFNDDQGNDWIITSIQDISSEKMNNSIIEKLHEETIYLANHDYLTDTLNRRGFIEHLKIEFARNKRENHFCALAILDIDYFKEVNDQYGHIVGDKILIYIVGLLKECLRPYDTIGRYGGDEFILCLPNLDSHSAEIIGERLRKHIQENPYNYDGVWINLTISIGIKLVNGLDFHQNDINHFISEVDRIMYQAKQKRNTVCISS